MDVRRTVPVALGVGIDDAVLLEDAVDTFHWSAQYVVDYAFQGEHVTTRRRRSTTKPTPTCARKQNGFNGGLVQAARNKAAKACKSVVARWKNGKTASRPTFTSPHVLYDHRTATLHDDYVNLATTNDCIVADYVLPDEDSDTPHAKYLFSNEYETTGAELHYCDGDLVRHIHSKREMESDTPKQATTGNGTVLGVDLGVNNLAVTSTGTFLPGDEFDHWRREYEKRRGDLEQCRTRWAHENIQSVGRKENDRFKQMLHCISNELVVEARENDCSVIAFEDLTDVRERTGASWGPNERSTACTTTSSTKPKNTVSQSIR